LQELNLTYEIYPARTTCVVVALPDPKMLIEIEGVASLKG
jgi:2-iminobutanoate/2-iminopropanoate deaminase